MWNSIVNLIAAAGVGSLLATFIQLYFENKRLIVERTSALNKEIYFRKVEAWERINTQLGIIDTQLNQYVESLKGPVFLANLDISMNERIKELSLLNVWFSEDVRNLFNEINEPFNLISQTYLLARAGKMVKEQGDRCVEAIRQFNKIRKLLDEKIRNELNMEKDSILKC